MTTHVLTALEMNRIMYVRFKNGCILRRLHGYEAEFVPYIVFADLDETDTCVCPRLSEILNLRQQEAPANHNLFKFAYGSVGSKGSYLAPVFAWGAKVDMVGFSCDCMGLRPADLPDLGYVLRSPVDFVVFIFLPDWGMASS